MLLRAGFFLLTAFGSAIALPSPSQVTPASVQLDERQATCPDFSQNNGDPPDMTVKATETRDGKKYAVYKWILEELDVKVYDKCKGMHTINGAWPPPPIVVEQGTIIEVTLVNKLPVVDILKYNEVSLHAHGFDQKNSQWLDGPISITQRGIPVGKKFTYRWNTQDEAPGTYWVHSHSSGQYPKGLRAPLIIKAKSSDNEASKWNTASWDPPSRCKASPNPLVPWDESLDQMLTLSEWFSQEWFTWDGMYMGGTCGTGVEVPPRDFLINDRFPTTGTGIQTYDFRTQKSAPKSGRLRIINMSAYLTYYVYVAPVTQPQSGQHHNIKLQVIEADGALMDGCSINDIVEVAPGQRLSVLVDPYAWAASNANAGTYNIVVAANPYEFRHVQANAKRPAGDSKFTNAACYDGPESFDQLRSQVPFHVAQIKLGDIATIPSARSPSFYLPTMLLSPADGTNRLCFPHLNGCTAANPDSYSISTNFIDYDDVKLQPLVASSPTLPSDQRHRFVIQTWEDKSGDTPSRRANLRVIRSDIQSNMENANGYTFFAPQDRPALEQIRQGDTNWDPWKHVMVLPTEANNYIIAFYSWTGTHPIHLHGHKFRVLLRERQQQVSEPTTGALVTRLKKVFTFTSASLPQDYAGNNIPIPANPLLRDTVTIYKYGLVVLHVEANNPGAWFIHCHNDFHASTGMAAMVIENPTAWKAKVDGLNYTTGAYEGDSYRKCVNGGTSWDSVDSTDVYP